MLCPRHLTQRIRPLLGVLAVLTLASCGGGDASSVSTPDRGAAALVASSPGALLAYAREKLRARYAERLKTPTFMDQPIAAPGLASVKTAAGDAVLVSTTTAQEAGVDEADRLKSDAQGRWLFTVHDLRNATGGQTSTRLQAYRRLDNGQLAAPEVLDWIWPVNSAWVLHGLQFAPAERRLAVLGEAVQTTYSPSPCAGLVDCVGDTLPAPSVSSSEVVVQFAGAPAEGGLVAQDEVRLSGRLVGSRRIGSVLYVVSVHTPALAVDALPLDTPVAEREAQLARLQTQDLLPTLRRNGGTTQPLLADTDCHLQPANASLGLEITSITAFDLADASLPQRSRCIVGGAEALYLSSTSLVLATTRWPAPVVDANGFWRYARQIQTDLHKFALNAGGVAYRGSGVVEGHLGWDTERKPYRISEHQGDLRVLSFTGEQGWASLADASTRSASPATLTILRERVSDQSLQAVATLPSTRRPAAIGLPGEQVYAVRFLGDKGYVVTFRQTDPLYVLDLADPTDPKIAGELTVPGFSDGLFPLGQGLLLGVGRQADLNGQVGGVKVSLFDVQDPAKPRELATEVLGERGSRSGVDTSPHGFNQLTVGEVSRVALPVFLTGPGYTPLQQGLQRFEVDLVKRGLRRLSMLAPSAPQNGSDVWAYDLWAQRSLQIGGQVYYLSQGTLAAWGW